MSEFLSPQLSFGVPVKFPFSSMERPEFNPSSCTPSTVNVRFAVITFVFSATLCPSICFGGFLVTTKKLSVTTTCTVVSSLVPSGYSTVTSISNVPSVIPSGRFSGFFTVTSMFSGTLSSFSAPLISSSVVASP